MKKVLLDKACLELHKFSATAGRYALDALHVTRERVEATDGRILASLPPVVEEYPDIEGAADLQADAEVLIPGDEAKMAARMLGKRERYVQVGKNGSATLAIRPATVTHLPAEEESEEESPRFPDTRHLQEVPEHHVTVTLTAKLVQTIAAYAHKYSAEGKLDLMLTGADEALHVSFKTDDGREARIVLMPVSRPGHEDWHDPEELAAGKCGNPGTWRDFVAFKSAEYAAEEREALEAADDDPE